MVILALTLIVLGIFYQLFRVFGTHVGLQRHHPPSESTSRIVDVTLADENDTYDNLLVDKKSAKILENAQIDPHDFLRGARMAYEMIMDRTFSRKLDDISDYVAPKAQDILTSTYGHEKIASFPTDHRVVEAVIDKVTKQKDKIFIRVHYTIHVYPRGGSDTPLGHLSMAWTYGRLMSTNDPNWVLEDLDIQDSLEKLNHH